MNKLCDNCGEPITPDNKEKYHESRDTYYCEECEDTYFQDIIEAEGPNSYGIRN